MFTRALIASLLAACLYATAQPAHARKGEVPEGMLCGATVPVSDAKKNPDADNVGAPLDVLAELYARSGANFIGMRYDWAECEPNDPGDGPSEYVWPDRSDDPFFKIPNLEKMVSLSLKTPEWAVELEKRKVAKDPAAMKRYWALVERFVTAASKHARENYGARYFHVPGNEPSLKSCTEHPVYEPEYPSWSNWYMDTAIHVSKGVKADSPDNQVVIGALVVGSAGHVGALYGAGAKGHFDVMDIHAYDQSGKTHVSMEQIMETHRVMAEHGDGDKKIYLGEGWSCFPLPKNLDGNLDRKKVYTRQDVEHYWKTIQVGWMNLTTPRPGEFDPDWVLGAKYFTFCDLIEGRGWRKRAVPQRDDSGKITHYLVDGYPKKEDELGPFFRPWGLVDVTGKPKGDLVESFPPYIPRYTFKAEIGGVQPGDPVAAERNYVVQIKITNEEDDSFERLRFDLYGRGKEGKKIHIRPARNRPVARLSPGDSARALFRVTFPDELKGKEVRFYGECWYTFDEKPYYADAWGPKLMVR